jgi:hypothetical protein
MYTHTSIQYTTSTANYIWKTQKYTEKDINQECTGIFIRKKLLHTEDLEILLNNTVKFLQPTSKSFLMAKVQVAECRAAVLLVLHEHVHIHHTKNSNITG